MAGETGVHIVVSKFFNLQARGWVGGGTPYIRMIGMIVVFLGVVIGDLVFFRGCSSKNL